MGRMCGWWIELQWEQTAANASQQRTLRSKFPGFHPPICSTALSLCVRGSGGASKEGLSWAFLNQTPDFLPLYPERESELQLFPCRSLLPR